MAVKNTSYSRLGSEKKTCTDLISHDLEFSNCNVYCNEYRKSAKEKPIANDFTRKDTHIEKEGSELCETSAYLTASRDEHNPDKENVTELHHNGASLVHPSEDEERISSASNVYHICAGEEYLPNHLPYSKIHIGITTDDNDRLPNENSDNHYEELSVYEDIRHSDHQHVETV